MTPGEIPLFLAKLEEGYDVVSGWRAQRKDNAVMRRLPSHIANSMMARLSGVDIHDFGNHVQGLPRREVIHNIPLYGEMHRFIPALASWYGAQHLRSAHLELCARIGQKPLRHLAHVPRDV